MTFVLVMAKAPVPGRVKTRLCPPCTPVEAAGIAAAALADTLAAVRASGSDRKVIALEGAAGPWIPEGFEVIAQRGTAFSERLANAWTDAGDEAGIQIGMDTPQVTPRLLDQLLAAVSAPGAAVLGHAVDGGWWVIGLPADRPSPSAIFEGIPMSTAATGAVQDARLRALGLCVLDAPVLRDIDTYTDLLLVADAAPDTRIAAHARATASVAM